MKGMPLPFEDFQGKGVSDFSSSSSSSCSPDSVPPQKYHPVIPQDQQEKWQTHNSNYSEDFCCYVQGSLCNIIEPRSVLEACRRQSPPTSSSTLSSSQGPTFTPGGGSATSTDTTTTTGLAATPTTAAATNNNNPSPVGTEKCGQPQPQIQQLGMEDWESVLSMGGNGGGSSSPSQVHSILGLIMGDIEDPSLGLNKLLQSGVGIGSHPDLAEFNNAGCFGMVDQVFNFEPIPPPSSGNDPSSLHGNASSSASPDFPPPGPTSLGRIGTILNQIPSPNPVGFPAAFSPGLFQQEQPVIEDEKPQIFNPLIINQSQSQFSPNPAMFLPLPYAQLQEHPHHVSPPPPKRLHPGPIGGGPTSNQIPKVPFSDSRPELLQRQQQMLHQQPAGMANSGKFLGAEELGNANNNSNNNNQQLQLQQLQQAIVNTICQAAELIELRKPVLAQGILARLNHQLSLPIGKPLHRAAFYFKKALQLLIHNINTFSTNLTNLSTCSLIFKIGAYKSFSEISPILQFANFTCNQALLEAFEGFDKIHIVDFDIGYGGQWSSLMQELALRSGGAPSFKITAFASPSSHDELELGFTQENLKVFAREINMPFELEILSLDSLNSGSWPMMPPPRVQDKEVIAVNLPIGAFSIYPSSLPLVLRFVRQLSPKIVVSLDRGCDRSDLPFALQVNDAIQSYSTLLESLDAVNVNHDVLQKIERFLVEPGIEKLVLGRQRCPDSTPYWRSLFLQSGFTPLTFSNFTESQAECLVQRTPVRGFHVEKRQSSLVLFWQRKELISASAWRC